MLFSISQTVRSHEVTNYEKHAASVFDIKSLKDKVKVINEDIQRIESINSNLKSEINKYAQFTLEHKFYYNDKLSEIKTELLEGISQLRTWFTKLDLRDTCKENIVNQQRKDIEQLVVELEQIRSTLNSNIFKELLEENKSEEKNLK